MSPLQVEDESVREAQVMAVREEAMREVQALKVGVGG